MAERKYQIFVSSTYRDLKNERDRLHKSILKAGCIPVGMEFFPAKDEKQIKYIQAEIDKCDYVVLVVGLQYGSVDDQGVSYTEQEYDYSVNKKKEIIVLIQEETESNHIDKTAETYEKLVAFRDKVTRNRLVCFWKDMADLVEAFHVSLNKAINQSPEVGWIRGGNMQIAKDIKMEVCSATNPDVFSEKEIECVSFVIDYQLKSIDMYLFEGYQPICSTDKMLRYYRSEALPWVIQVAKTCQLVIKITNPYPFPLNKIEWEDRLFDLEGQEIAIPDLSDMLLYPPRPPYDPVPRMSPEMFQKDEEINLNPKRSLILPFSLYYIPEQERELIFQRSFFADKIEDPIKKQVKVRFRIKKAILDFNQFVRLVQGFEGDNGLNHQQILDELKGVVCQMGKEQDSCDTQK